MEPPALAASHLRSARQQLVWIAVVQVLALSCWFSASAVAPALRDAWALSAAQASWLTAAVQLGFALGALATAFLNAADMMPAHLLVGCSALLAGAVTAAVALASGGFESTVMLRFLTGVALAGVYPPGLKLMASWFNAGRGRALGVLIAALTLGSSLPQLINAFQLLPWRLVLLITAGLSAGASLIAVTQIRVGPFASNAPGLRPRYAVEVFRNRRARLALIGYVGHMWELYPMWTWTPLYIGASLEVAGHGSMSRLAVGLTAFVSIGLAGMGGSLWGGLLGDRYGPARVASWAMRLSAASCGAAALVWGTRPTLFLPVLAIWGATVIADSGLFSSCLVDAVDSRFLGTALAIQTFVGYLVTAGTIHLFALIVATCGWRPAVLLLAVGPLCGAVAMQHLQIETGAGSAQASVLPSTGRHQDESDLGE